MASAGLSQSASCQSEIEFSRCWRQSIGSVQLRIVFGVLHLNDAAAAAAEALLETGATI